MDNEDFIIYEVFDGGHCYIRARRDHENYIEIERWPRRAPPEAFKALADWANLKLELTDAK